VNWHSSPLHNAKSARRQPDLSPSTSANAVIELLRLSACTGPKMSFAAFPLRDSAISVS
jgi:hypothetical protein